MEQHFYKHKVQYYETDQMGIVHHSNYIRWFEEARVDFLNNLGIGYKKMEESGIISPVVEVHAVYRTMTHFDDVVEIQIKVQKYNGIVLELCYEVCDEKTRQVRCAGDSRHCFLNREGQPISLKKSYPDFDKILQKISDK